MRKVCDHCQLPLKSCLCQWTHSIDYECDWAVWQDPAEAKHAKNTLRLLSLCWPKLKLFRYSQLDDVSHFQQWLAKGPVYLVFPVNKACLPGYPAPKSHHLDDWLSSLTHSNSTECIKPRLLFIDATWRKATAMILQHQDIACLPRLSLNLPEHAQYVIRKSPNAQSLSTFEAVMGCLSIWCQANRQLSGGSDEDEVHLQRLWQGYRAWQASIMAFRKAGEMGCQHKG
ncbi:DTW domain-containing protein [Thiomicrospira sp. ALE5]|uniref:DTW domain-containing protein n=1 Tax=Thiomicrospira sp. ALE5 TaxID=748650 RepID=UPI0008EE7B0E|nr:tRNA-uridine aminocarboxypropyltransferase [Thiomicrospira sp. ALE5]SFR52207.1 DTW domain-containing protein YfiP [Thiomicrospira sp. ALE5]